MAVTTTNPRATGICRDETLYDSPATGDDAASIQAAVDAGGYIRFMKSDTYTITEPITIGDNTTLDLGMATIKAASTWSGNPRCFENSDTVSGNSNIAVINGTIDVNSITDQGLYFVLVDSLSVKGVTILDPDKHCISLSTCSDFDVLANRLTNAGDDGVSIITGCHHGTVSDNIINGGAKNGTGGGSSGIEIEDGSHDISVRGNTIDGIQDNTSSCIHCVVDASGTGGVYNISIGNNVCSNSECRGIGVINNKTDDSISSMSGTDGGGTITLGVTGHNLTNETTWKILIQGVTDSGLDAVNGEHIATYSDDNNITISVAATGTYTSGGSVIYDNNNITISGNTIDDMELSGVTISASRNISVSGNSINRTGVAGSGTPGINMSAEQSQIVANAVSNSGSDNITLSSADQVLVNSNTVRNAGQTTANKYAILINSSTNCSANNNQCIDDQDTLSSYGVRSLNGGPNRIIGNEVATCKTNGGVRILSNGTGDVVQNNAGHVTSNHGSTGAIATGATTAHGLVSTPTKVSVSPADSGVQDFYATADGTNITITYTGGGTHDFWWSAEV
jgi:hypothetical protein